MAQTVALATPAKRLSVQFREDLEQAIASEVDNQFEIIAFVFGDGQTGVTYDWGRKLTIRWRGKEYASETPWSTNDGKRFCYDVGRFFLHEKEEGDEAE